MRRTSIIVPVVALALVAGCNGGSAQSESFHNGTFIVGTDIREGDYVTEGATDSKCTIEVTPKEGSGFQKTADKGEPEKITLESGEEVVTAGCEEFVRR
jgi:hypothetical protein